MVLEMANKICSKQSFLILIFSSFTLAFAGDTLKVSEIFGFDQTLISSGQKFEAGFFTPPGSEPNKIYLGIWYYNLPDPKTIVWVANRDNPARNSSVSLSLKSDGGGQIVVRWNDIELWTSNKSTSNVVSPFVRLLDTGNLVVQEDKSNGDYIWQSFDHPGDTLLSGQKLGWTRKTGLDRRLISWKGKSDPSSGNYTNSLTRTGDPELFVNSGTKIIYRSGPFTGQRFSGIPAMTTNSGINFTLIDTPDEVYYMFTLIDKSIRSRLVVSPDGILYRYTWVPQNQHWSTFWYHPEVLCDNYLECGPYGVCDGTKLFGCVCLHGFEFKDPLAVSLRDGSQGCVRKTMLECEKDGFRVKKNMKLPMSGAATVDLGKVLDECQRACKKNCNCTAYANARLVDGVASGCVMWTGDLLDMRTFEEGGQDLYIRLAAADLRTDNDMGMKFGIGIGVSVATLLVAIAAYLAWKAKHKPNDPNGTATPINGEDEYGLPMYNFETIVQITNDFSDENKLGQGGFGPVYKGVLDDGTAVAIKRLAKYSIQGFDEFKNEVHLIAKLQHRNLVRLLGYCVDKEEKLLIYEFLRHLSLDRILFDKERSSMLDWKKRFTILVGVAKGLSYLHHDSRETIIHRDLKASNILLDDDMNPKISDFGMARIFKGDDTETDTTRRVVGTYGYMSPEYMRGVISIKSDVFSFGVLMLEIVTGMRVHSSNQHHNLLEYVWEKWDKKDGTEKEAIDPAISDSYSINEVLKCIQVGLLCVQANPKLRPKMSKVILMLSNETTELPQPTLPGFYLGLNQASEADTNPLRESFSVNQLSVTIMEGR